MSNLKHSKAFMVHIDRILIILIILLILSHINQRKINMYKQNLLLSVRKIKLTLSDKRYVDLKDNSVI